MSELLLCVLLLERVESVLRRRSLCVRGGISLRASTRAVPLPAKKHSLRSFPLLLPSSSSDSPS